MESVALNWPAITLGTVAAYGLGLIWFSPILFGKAWSQGSHNLARPKTPPIAAMIVQLTAVIALAILVGMTASTDALGTAIIGILSAALFVAGIDLFSQKSTTATFIDAGYVVASGTLMILSQGLL